MNQRLKQLSEIWLQIRPFFSVPHTEKDYLALVDLVDDLIDEIGEDEDHPLIPLMETIGLLIENYEEQAGFMHSSSPLEALKYLIQEHGLEAADLTEIGDQKTIQNILNGQTELDLEQIKKISQRFHVSPLVFIHS